MPFCKINHVFTIVRINIPAAIKTIEPTKQFFMDIMVIMGILLYGYLMSAVIDLIGAMLNSFKIKPQTHYKKEFGNGFNRNI